MAEHGNQPVDRIGRMAALTRLAHADQTRNGGRVPYWAHPAAVADICRVALAEAAEVPADVAEDIILAGYGHDLYEDTTVTRELVRREFGDRVDGWIAALTNERGDTDRVQYLGHFTTAEDEVRIVKCADLVDNMLSVAYGLHDLGLPWVRDFFLPIAGETRDVLRATPFVRLPRTGGHMLVLVEWAWRRMVGSVEAGTGHGWAEDGMTDSEAGAQAPGDADYDALFQRLTFTPEQAERAREQLRLKEQERTRRLFGDNPPFAIPDTDTDS